MNSSHKSILLMDMENKILVWDEPYGDSNVNVRCMADACSLARYKAGVMGVELEAALDEFILINGAWIEDDPKALIEALTDALLSLYDEQNGPPLLNRQRQWEEAMAKAKRALAMAEKVCPVR